MSVSIARIPPAEDGSKQGIDDYLARGGLLDDLEILPFEDGWLPPRDWPTLSEQAYHGIAGEIVKIIEPNTESDPVAILAVFLAAYGNLIGCGAHFVVEGDRHYCKLWPVLVGESGKGRKGTAQGRVDRLMEEVDLHWYYNCKAQGLSSGEGLIYHVRDRKTKEKDGETIVVDEGVVDKRLMLTEAEFTGPLTVMQREGNTLSVAVRMAWDDTTLQTLTKNAPEKSTKSHVTIVSHTNKDELVKHLTTAKLGGGVGNRFFFLLVKRSKVRPRGGAEDEIPTELLRRLRKAEEFGKVEREITFSEEKEEAGMSAADLWDRVYEDLSTGAPGLFGTVTGRSEAYVWRFAMAYACLDASPEIKIAHLLAALALWEYSKQSSYLVFRGKTGDEIADEILQSLQAAGDEGMSRTEISDHLGRNVKASRIRAALIQLHRDGWARAQKEPSKGPGRPEERWFASIPGEGS
jgi:hypothetical protein